MQLVWDYPQFISRSQSSSFNIPTLVSYNFASRPLAVNNYIEGVQSVLYTSFTTSCFLVAGQVSKTCSWLQIVSVLTIRLQMNLALFSL